MSCPDVGVWLQRNQAWARMSPAERRAYVQGQMYAYRDVFDVLSEAFKTDADVRAVFDRLSAAYDVEVDRATVAGIL